MPPSKKQKVSQNNEETDVRTDVPSTSKGFDYDWREKSTTYKERHKYALKQGVLTDVIFSVGNTKTIFHSHKMILALASPVFEAMFYGSLKETSETIDIPDLLPNGFKLLLDFIYTDEVNFPSETDAFSAWVAADKYCVSHMKEACFKHLLQCTLSNSNVWIILENAGFLGCQKLEDRCINYLKKNIEVAIEEPRFCDISSETVIKILKLDTLYIKEITLLKSVVKWSQEKLKSCGEKTLQQLLQPFLPYIRIGCLSQVDFVDFVTENKNVISDTDALQILKFMIDDRVYSLPQWCSTNVYPRKIDEKGPRVTKVSWNFRSYTRPTIPPPEATVRQTDEQFYRDLQSARQADEQFHRDWRARVPRSYNNPRPSNQNRFFNYTDSSSTSSDEELVRPSSNIIDLASGSSDTSTSSSSSSSSSSSDNSLSD